MNAHLPLVVLDPTAGPVTEPTQRARRPSGLAGLRLGLLHNGKRNSDKVLMAVGEELRRRFDLAGVGLVAKPSPYKPAPPEVYDELRRYDLIVTGIGD